MPRASKTATTAPAPEAAEPAVPAPSPDSPAGGSSTMPAPGGASEAPSPEFIAAQHAMLLAERDVYMQQADSLRAAAEQMAQEMEPGDVQFDEESGEGGTMNVERERDLTLSAQARAAVDEIDQALARIDAGTYGICERCRTPIPRARLEALPYASLCVACKSGGLSRR